MDLKTLPGFSAGSMRPPDRRSPVTLLVVATALFALQCVPGPERQRRDAESISVALEAFLPRLGEAYASGDVGPLRGWAAPRELAAVGGRIADLAAAGTILEVTFRGLTVEQVTAVSPSSVSVTTLEIWDVRSLEVGSGEILSENPEQHMRVRYQLKRKGDTWQVLSRTIQE